MKKKRKCGKCGKEGHTKKTCELIKARKEIKQSKQKPDRLEIDGVIPKKGLWIIHEKKQIVVGKIRKVTPFGEIHYTSVIGAQVKSKQENFLEGGYNYVDLEPSHLKWQLGLN